MDNRDNTSLFRNMVRRPLVKGNAIAENMTYLSCSGMYSYFKENRYDVKSGVRKRALDMKTNPDIASNIKDIETISSVNPLDNCILQLTGSRIFDLDITNMCPPRMPNRPK